MAADLPSGYRRRAFETLPSTSAEALALARTGEPGGLWITAGEQSRGRGRRGRAWTTGHGNLAASLLLIDPSPVPVSATLSFVAGIAVHQAVADVGGATLAERLSLKWPNDLLLDGAKVAGILIEGERLQDGRFAVVVGIGVNCVSHPDIDGPVPASDLLSRGIPVEAEALFGRIATHMAAEVARWNRGAGFPAIRSAWLARCTGIGSAIRVSLPDRVVDGRFADLDADGRLILVQSDGTREVVTAGDVFFAAAG